MVSHVKPVGPQRFRDSIGRHLKLRLHHGIVTVRTTGRKADGGTVFMSFGRSAPVPMRGHSVDEMNAPEKHEPGMGALPFAARALARFPGFAD